MGPVFLCTSVPPWLANSSQRYRDDGQPDGRRVHALQAGVRRGHHRSPGNPLEDIDTLRDVQFVMKDGTVFKRDGVVTPESFFHGGPGNGWRIR